MSEVIKVGIADFNVCKSPDKITTIGLGSCVGIVLYSAKSDWCGLAHIMLPSSKEIKHNMNRAKFADTCLEDLISVLDKKGVKRQMLNAKIAGGATMFQFSGGSDTLSIGDRNVKSVKAELASYGIRIVAEDTGENYGRTIIYDPATQDLLIKSAGKPEKTI